MFIDADALEAKLVATLQKVGIEPDSYWKPILQDALQTSFMDILHGFLARGYSATQVGGWDYGPAFQTDLGLFWALTKGGATQNYSDTFLRSLDRRAEIRGDPNAGILPIPLIVAGVAVPPVVGATPSRVSGGRLRASDDLATMDFQP